MSANISHPENFKSGATLTAQRALYNPDPSVRKQAQLELRANSAFSPEQWAQFDVAAGVRTKDEAKELVADSPMTVDSWVEYGDEIRGEHERAATSMQYLLSSGFGIPSTLARYAYLTQMREHDMDAEVSMNGRSESNQDMPVYGMDGVVQPIIHSDYEIDGREYQNSQAFGENLNAQMAMEARRSVDEKEDDILFNGLDLQIDVRGVTVGVDGLAGNHNKKLTGSLSDWSTASNIFSDVDAMHRGLESQADDENVEVGPVPETQGAILFLPRQEYANLSRGEYETSATDEPAMVRFERQYPHVDVQLAPRLGNGQAIMLTRDNRYFGIANAQGPTNTSWEVDGGQALRNKVLSSRVPYIKEQPDGIYGISHFN